LPTWWDYELQAIKETDPDKKDEIYQKGLKKYPNSFELHSQLHYQVQVLRIFYNALLLDRDFREYSLKRVRNCH
jgi:hypothetical protein